MAARKHDGSQNPLPRLRAVSRLILLAGGLLMVTAAGLIVVEVVLRQLFHRTLGGVDELAGFALAVATSWSFGTVLLEKAHVRIDTLYSRFGERNRALFDIIGLCGTLFFSATLLFFAVEVLRSSLRFGTTSQSSLAVPVSAPQALWLAGLLWFLIVTVALLAASLGAAFRGDWRGVGRLAGARGMSDEIRSEIEVAGTRRNRAHEGPEA